MTSTVKYPEIEVELVGDSGNAFYIVGKVAKALKRARVPEEEVALFRSEAMSGDFDHLLQTCMRWVDVS